MTREEALKDLKHFRDHVYWDGMASEALDMAIEALEQEPKTGKWLAVGFDGYADGYPVVDLWECSECHEEHYGEEDTLTMYCPNCGADMREGE